MALNEILDLDSAKKLTFFISEIWVNLLLDKLKSSFLPIHNYRQS
jgi:hypothetical protein